VLELLQSKVELVENKYFGLAKNIYNYKKEEIV
jgi:hypothetical protein